MAISPPGPPGGPLASTNLYLQHPKSTMECHLIAPMTLPGCCNLHIHAKEPLTFQDVSGPPDGHADQVERGLLDDATTAKLVKGSFFISMLT